MVWDLPGTPSNLEVHMWYACLVSLVFLDGGEALQTSGVPLPTAPPCLRLASGLPWQAEGKGVCFALSGPEAESGQLPRVGIPCVWEGAG